MKENVLKQVALFGGLPDDEISRLAGSLSECQFDSGAVFIHEDATAELFFVVIEGEVEIIKALGTLNERLLNVSGAGTFLGEMGLFHPGSRRTASARARTPVRLLQMTRADFDGLLHRQPGLAYEMVRVLSIRLDHAQNQTIRELEAKNLQLTQAYIQLKTAQDQLIEKEKIERELEVARKIQQSMVPRKHPGLAGFDFGARMAPARAVGGDFFDFIPLNDETLGIAIGDVSDKGVPAALFMALTSNLLRAEARRSNSGGETLRNVHRQLMEINDAGMFVTVFYGALHGATRQLHYARAGHELPIICDARGELMTLPQAPGLPLGAADEIFLDEQTIVLPPGGTVLFYTDGVTDALDTQGREFGLERLRQLVVENRNNPAQAICDTLLKKTESHRAENPQYDDITLVAIRVE
jgi:serine phosphatase RsbU (regulator of sigma subunit)